ncbi:MAG: stage II sporulation protein M [Bacillota bacterium]|jgi:stage II sporulation protein M|nr:stage II sporulation protein M [Bacillota bacterium]HPT36144.1 stage II sporulation protein M [Bacillota bacterium]HPZ86255.1 stage II sporulation protein M [Bacillota bacterium]
MKTRAVASPIVFCSLLLISGLIMGALGLRVLSPDEKAELASYLEVFMRGLSNPGLEPPVILRLSLAHNLKSVALLWAFGLAVIGAPLTCIMLFIRGFALGFSSAFVVQQVPQKGFLVFASGMLPHNLVALPALVLLSSVSLSFSVKLFRERPWVQGGLLKLAAGYTLRFALMSMLLLAASLLEAYLTPFLLRKAVGYL